MTSNQLTAQDRVHTAAATRASAEARLDAAPADTFPASDPVAITVCEPPRRPQGAEGPRAAGDSG